MPFILEPYLLFKYGFGTSCTAFVKKYAGYVLVSALSCSLSFLAASAVKCTESIPEILIKGGVALAVTNVLLVILYGADSEFKYLISFVSRKAKAGKNKKATV